MSRRKAKIAVRKVGDPGFTMIYEVAHWGESQVIAVRRLRDTEVFDLKTKRSIFPRSRLEFSDKASDIAQAERHIRSEFEKALARDADDEKRLNEFMEAFYKLMNDHPGVYVDVTARRGSYERNY